MSLQTLANAIPDYASDLRSNLLAIGSETLLTPTQLWGSVIAAAFSCRSRRLWEELAPEAATHLSPQTLHAAKSAAALMASNNVFFRFSHLCSHPAYRKMPSRLHGNATLRHGAKPLDFELWCLAVSALHGCQACIDRHEQSLRQHGITEPQILAAVRIASVLHAVALVLEAESFSEPK